MGEMIMDWETITQDLTKRLLRVENSEFYRSNLLGLVEKRGFVALSKLIPELLLGSDPKPIAKCILRIGLLQGNGLIADLLVLSDNLNIGGLIENDTSSDEPSPIYRSFVCVLMDSDLYLTARLSEVLNVSMLNAFEYIAKVRGSRCRI